MSAVQVLDELIVEQAPDAMIYADLQGVIVRWNRAAEKMFGYRAEEALGQSLDLIIPVHLRAAHWKGFQQAVRSGVTVHQGAPVLTGACHKNGERVYAEMSFALLSSRTGDVIGALAIARARTNKE